MGLLTIMDDYSTGGYVHSGLSVRGQRELFNVVVNDYI